MTNPTVNRAYDMPASTDLVTNLPADFAIFGDAVDLDISSGGGYTSTATAAGTTTLTILSNRNQRFTGVTTQNCDMPVASTLAVGARWVIQNKSTGIVTVRSSGGNTIYAIPAGTTAEFVCILASGTTAASWDYDWAGSSAAPTGGIPSWVEIGSSVTTSGTTVTVSGLSGYNNLWVSIENVSPSTVTSELTMRFNADSAANYPLSNYNIRNANQVSGGYVTADTSIYLARLSNAATKLSGGIRIHGANGTGKKFFEGFTSIDTDSTTSDITLPHIIGIYNGTSVISSVSIITTATAFDLGTLRVFGSVA